MPGQNSTISIGGARSEVLAEYMFAAWGAALRGRIDSDFGVDLFCAMTEHIGKRSWVRSNYTVQVKSNRDPWQFSSGDEVRWLIQHPTPLFLCVVEKTAGRICVYQTFARFRLWAGGTLPSRIRLVPGDGHSGEVLSWETSPDFSLGAPILELKSSDLFKEEVLEQRRQVLEAWIQMEQWNLRLVQMGLFRFQAPHGYETNSRDFHASVGMGLGHPTDEQLAEAVVTAREVLDCVGSQLYLRGDVTGALEAGLLFHWLEKRFPGALGNGPLAGPRAMSPLFHDLIPAGSADPYLYEGVDGLQRHLEEQPVVRALKHRRGEQNPGELGGV